MAVLNTVGPSAVTVLVVAAAPLSPVCTRKIQACLPFTSFTPSSNENDSPSPWLMAIREPFAPEL
ncbi:hypothetical protein WKI68_20305 [Streptomyces sp. MS1.HAVA.3]|uniref:Secreted protein n=1 Tax=Streptomyces caledonius TaxID=3134107 RepID=A0ABU8U5D4_9ACTN